jgi:hypothetical protein
MGVLSLFKRKKWGISKQIHLPNVFVISIPKVGESASSNADSVAIDSEKFRFAVADGVSQSFDPGSWSRLLVESFVNGDFLNASTFQRLAAQLDTKSSDDEPWYVAEMRDKGSFSTFLSMELKPSQSGMSCYFQSIGDCCAFHVRANQILDSWPYKRLEDFPVRPRAISSLPPFVDTPIDSTMLTVAQNDEIWITTDALAKFIVSSNDQDLDVFLEKFTNSQNARDETVFSIWATELRRSGRIEDDDLSIMRIMF